MRIDSIVRERHLLTHPFYQRWQKGKVPIEVLREYAKQYYHYESALPSFIESALKHVQDPEVSKALQGVLEDESSNPKPHAELWLDFAKGLGLEEKEVRESEATPRTSNLVETYRALSLRGGEEALAALYAYESQFPDVALAKAEGLRKFYGVSDQTALEFFDLHSTLDVEHAKAIRSGVADSEIAHEATHLALDVWWGMLDQFETLSAAT
jgi:pyrroloquinoline-quinone synthase